MKNKNNKPWRPPDPHPNTRRSHIRRSETQALSPPHSDKYGTKVHNELGEALLEPKDIHTETKRDYFEGKNGHSGCSVIEITWAKASSICKTSHTEIKGDNFWSLDCHSDV